MRKILLVVGILMATLTTQAQEKSQGLKGAWWATAQIGYQQTKQGDVKGTNTTILPLAGCFISPSVTVGAGIGMINIKADNATGTAANTSLIVFEPLVRKYWNVSGNLYFFGQLATPIISGKEKESNTKVTQFGAAMSGGFDFFVSKSVSVEFSYDLANFTATTIAPDGGTKTTVTNFSVAHVATAEAAHVDALGGSGPNLTTPLSFGFKFIF